MGIIVAWRLTPATDPTGEPRVPGEIVELRPAHPSRYENRQAGTPGRTSYTFTPGDCVSGSGVVEPVPCDEPHSGLIVGSAFDPAQCPTGTDAIIRGQEIPTCIDLDG